MPSEPGIYVIRMPAQKARTGNQNPGWYGIWIPDDIFAYRLWTAPEQTCKVVEVEKWSFHSLSFPPVSQGKWRPAASAHARQRHEMSVASRVGAGFIGLQLPRVLTHPRACNAFNKETPEPPPSTCRVTDCQC